MVKQTLIDYIKKSFDSGFSKERIKNSLIKVGWLEKDINETFLFLEQEKVKLEQKDISTIKSSKVTDKELGFKLGKFWIVAAFSLGAVSLIITSYSLISSQIIGVVSKEILFLSGFNVILAILAIISAIGLIKRKKYGLYLVYLFLVSSILGDFFAGSSIIMLVILIVEDTVQIGI